MTMQIWKIERKDRGGYDTFDSAVVIAETEQEARFTSPNGYQVWLPESGWVRESTMNRDAFDDRTWTSPDNVTATEIGRAHPGSERRVIVASFNAG
jgi:hypothetical protein